MTLHNKNIHFAFKADNIAAERFEAFKQRSRIYNDSYALRYLMKLALDSYDLIAGKTDLYGLPLEVHTAIDDLSIDQQQALLDLLSQKLGIREIQRIRNLA